MAGFAAFLAFLVLILPAQADEIEPEPAPAAEPAPEAEPEPEPEPVVEPEVVSDEDLPEPSWIPSIDVGLETFDYQTTTSIQNSVNGPSWEAAQSDEDRQLMFRIGGELMGPGFEDLPGRPRLFVQGGVQFRTFSSDEIFAIGDPLVANQPELTINDYNRRGNIGGVELPTAFAGQGSQVSASFQDPSWYAAVGVAFNVPIATNLLLQIKPSVAYSVEEIALTGDLTTISELDPHEDPDFDIPTRTFEAPSRSRATGTTTDHSVGAGLEFAMVLFRNLRPIRVSIYTGARFMWLVSGRSTTFGDSTGIASYTVTRDEFGIKGGAGVRLSWVGFD